jgi:uncharacterized protein YlxW (UPF0749 family)
MKITKKEQSLLDEWVQLHKKVEDLNEELKSLSLKLKSVDIRLYAKKHKAELEDFRDYLDGEIGGLDKKNDKDRISQLKSLKAIVEHDINIENLVEQEIDIEEQGVKIDLKDY